MAKYYVRARGNALQVVGERESANAVYDGPDGLGVMEYLPAGCTFTGGVGDGTATYRADLGKYVPLRPDITPAVSPVPPVTAVSIGPGWRS